MIEKIAFYAALNLHLLALIILIASLKVRKLDAVSRFVFLPALAAQALLMAVRWYNVGHPPMFGTFENSLTTSFFIVGIAQYFLWRRELPKSVAAGASVMAMGFIAYGLRFDTSKIPLTISERSFWVDLHAFTAMGGFAFFTLAAVLVFRQFYLFAQRSGEKKELDELVLKCLMNGFGFFTIALGFGGYYAFLLYGKWWKWDPVETVSLIGWLIYGLAIHLRLFYGWKRLKLSWLVLLGFAVMIVAFWAIMYFPDSYHIFDLGYVKHV